MTTITLNIEPTKRRLVTAAIALGLAATTALVNAAFDGSESSLFGPVTITGIQIVSPVVVDPDAVDIDNLEGEAGSMMTTQSSELPAATLKRLRKLDAKVEAMRPLFEKVAAKEGLPWQTLAALTYRETSLDPTRSALSGERLGTRNYDEPGVITTSLEDSLHRAAKIYKAKAKERLIKVQLDPNGNTPDELVKVFVAYNRGVAYQRDGMDPWTSPYATNGLDEAHMNMTWPKGDVITKRYGPGRRDSRGIGAYTLYRYLGGPVR